MQTQAIEDMVESHAESMLMSSGRPSKNPRDAPEYLALGRIAKRDWSNSRLIKRLFEYERRIENSLYKALGKLGEVQRMRRMAETDAAEVQRRAQADAEADSTKQSQSTTAKLSSGPSRRLFDPIPEELRDFVIRTYGKTYPTMVQALLKHWDSSPARGGASAKKPVPASSPQTQTSSKKKDIPLSPLKI